MCRDASVCCGEGICNEEDIGAVAAYYYLAVASVLRLGCMITSDGHTDNGHRESVHPLPVCPPPAPYRVDVYVL